MYRKDRGNHREKHVIILKNLFEILHKFSKVLKSLLWLFVILDIGICNLSRAT